MATQADAFLLTTQIAASSGITRSVNRPVKYSGNPVFNNPHGTWDYLADYPQVFTDPTWDAASRYRMLYQGFPSDASQLYQCYAQSADGLSWTRPIVGRYTYGGVTTNNIVIPNTPTGQGSWYDGTASAGRKWLVVTDNNGAPFQDAIYAADDVTGPYTLLSTVISGSTPSIDAQAVLQRADGLWIVYAQDGVNANNRTIRAYLSTSSDLATASWIDQGIIITNGGVNDQRYSIKAVRATGLIYAFVTRFNASMQQIDTIALYVSPEASGLAFTLADATWLSVGAPSAWDYPELVGGAPVRVGDEWWHYYAGLQYFHNAVTPPFGGQVGLAKIGYGRIGQIAGAGGTLTSTALSPAVPHLLLNADASAPGARVDVALLDAGTGLPITGYTVADSDGIMRNTVAGELTWSSGTRHLPTNGALQLQFFLTGAAVLYGYTVSAPPVAPARWIFA
jgi:hypothetical protein